MKRLLRTMAATFVFLMICSLVAYYARYIPITEFWFMALIATIILIVGIGLGFVKATAGKIVAFFVNAISMGFYLRCWYINRGFDNSLWLMISVTVLAVAYMVFFALPLLIPAVNRHFGLYLTIFTALSLTGYILLIVYTTTTWVSTLGYYGILLLSFVLGSGYDCNDFDDEMQALLVSSYGIVICAFLILLIAIAGDGCSCDGGCDGGCSPGNSDFGSPIKSKSRDKAAKNTATTTAAEIAAVAAAAKIGSEEEKHEE